MKHLQSTPTRSISHIYSHLVQANWIRLKTLLSVLFTASILFFLAGTAHGSREDQMMDTSTPDTTTQITTVGIRNERPGPFLHWPLPASRKVTDITRLPDTPWSYNFLGIIDCPPYPATINNNRSYIKPGVSDSQVRWHNPNMVIACYKGNASTKAPYDHAGTDITADNGTPVFSAAWANQVMVSHNKNNGQYRIALRHPNVNNTGQTWYTYYVHLSSSEYSEGTHNLPNGIATGTKIGAVGENHLHFQVGYEGRGSYWEGDARNPWGVDMQPWDGCLWVDQSICPIQTIEPDPPTDASTRSVGHFGDVPINHALYPYVEALYAAGVISGENGSYNPDGDLTRGQSAKLIIDAIGEYREYTDNQCAFPDVCPGNTFYHYIRRLKDLGITSGQNNNFNPDAPLVRGGLVKFIVLAHDRSEPTSQCDGTILGVPCTDTFYSYVRRLNEIFRAKNIPLGNNGEFHVGDTTKRGEAAKLVTVGLDLEHRIPILYDVLEDNVFYQYILDMYERGLTKGCDPNLPLFCTHEQLTRGQLAAFIVRGLGDTPHYSDSPTFPDVQPGDTFYHEIEHLAAKGVVSGENGYFKPNDPVTRGQAAKMIVIAFDGIEPNQNDYPIPTFPDVSQSHTFYHYIERLYDLGFISGYSSGRYEPDRPITRAEFSKIVANAFIYNTPLANQEPEDQQNNNCNSSSPGIDSNTTFINVEVTGQDTDCYTIQLAAATSSMVAAAKNPYRIETLATGINTHLQIDLIADDGTLLVSKQRTDKTDSPDFTYVPTSKTPKYIRISNKNQFANYGVYTAFSANQLSTQMGDVNCDQRLGIADAVFIAQTTVQLRETERECTANQSIVYDLVCDGSGDERCGIADAVFVAQCLVGAKNPLCPQTNILQTNLQSQQSSVLFGNSSNAMSLSSEQVASSETVDIELTANIQQGNLAGAVLEITYDAGIVQAVECIDISSCNLGTTGTILLSNFEATGATGNFVIGKIKFRAVGTAGAKALLHLSATELVDQEGNQISALVNGGEICITPCSGASTNITVVSITGSSVGQVGQSYTFLAVIEPADATTPIQYTWSPSPLNGQGTNTAVYRWQNVGEHEISISVNNLGEIRGDGDYKIFLPHVAANTSASAADVSEGETIQTLNGSATAIHRIVINEEPSDVSTATPTALPQLTATLTPIPTPPPTNTPIPTNTSTPTPIPTSTPTKTPLPTHTSTPVPTPTATPFFFSDNFSSTSSGWPTVNDSAYQARYRSNEYEITINGNSVEAWQTNSQNVTIPSNIANYSVEARMRLYSGSPIRYGFVFDVVNSTNFYIYTVNPDSKSWRLERVLNGNRTTISEGTNSVINTGGTTNLLRVKVQNGRIYMYVNGIQVDSQNGGAFTGSRRAGLAAKAGTATVTARYDDFSYRWE
ncbi:MAG: S-layer homology domain-containing protein [Caldilineaceae bacterium]